MKIENPNQTDLANLNAGDVIKINGQRTRYTVDGSGVSAGVVVGPRGGVAYLVPSVNGQAIQISKGLGSSNKRDWIRSMEIEYAA